MNKFNSLTKRVRSNRFEERNVIPVLLATKTFPVAGSMTIESGTLPMKPVVKALLVGVMAGSNPPQLQPFAPRIGYLVPALDGANF